MTGRSRAVFAALLFAAIALALGLAAAPQLHDQLHHHSPATHQCAVTLFSSGSVENTACEPAATAQQPAPLLHILPIVMGPRVVARIPASLLEHAPPAQS